MKSCFSVKIMQFFLRKMVHIVIERCFSFFFQSDLKIFLITDSPFNKLFSEDVGEWFSSLLVHVTKVSHNGGLALYCAHPFIYQS